MALISSFSSFRTAEAMMVGAVLDNEDGNSCKCFGLIDSPR